jgi:hypothetical protein
MAATQPVGRFHWNQQTDLLAQFEIDALLSVRDDFRL